MVNKTTVSTPRGVVLLPCTLLSGEKLQYSMWSAQAAVDAGFVRCFCLHQKNQGYEYVTYNDDNPNDVDVNFNITVQLEANTLYVVAVRMVDAFETGYYTMNILRQVEEE